MDSNIPSFKLLIYDIQLVSASATPNIVPSEPLVGFVFWDFGGSRISGSSHLRRETHAANRRA
jgi:hypothetical protein